MRKLSREEIPTGLIEEIHKAFSSPLIDLKDNYKPNDTTRRYKTKYQIEPVKKEKVVPHPDTFEPTEMGVDAHKRYKITTEKRYADIVAVVEVFEYEECIIPTM